VKLNELLSTDMATLAREGRAAVSWWVEEMQAMIPATVRRMGARVGPVIAYDRDGQLALVRDGARAEAPMPGTLSQPATIVVPADQILQRSITMPAMGRADLARMIALDSERFLPLPEGSALIASAIARRDETEGKMDAELAALPMPNARALAEAMTASAIVPERIRIARSDLSPDMRFDFLPAMRDAGLVATNRNARAQWWLLVGFLFLLNLGTLIWRDSAAVGELQSLVDAQRPAVEIAQRISSRMQRSDALVRRAVDRRTNRDAMAILAAASAAVPDGAWVQRYVWEGDQLRLTGYKARDVDVAAALRRTPRFASVKSAQTDTLAEIAAGQPFDLAIKIKGN
jgi:Tfp pilus assembly protein PilN